MVVKKFYEKYAELFKYYDYSFERYKIPFSVALVKFDDNVAIDIISFEALKRHSDKCLKLNEKSYFFIFLATDIKKSYQALLNLEKKLIRKYNLYQLEHIFCSAVVSKKYDRSAREMIRICIELINECTVQQNIITEDDF